MEVEAKPPSFVPMPQHALPFQPQGVEIVLWRVPNSGPLRDDLHKSYPERHLGNMGALRLRELQATTEAMDALLGHDAWHLAHDPHGKPCLHCNGSTLPSIGITHAQLNDDTWAAVARWQDRQHPGGVDLADIHDPRISRVAPRVMGEEELERWQGQEAWAWAAKEAMFKGHGPSLDYRTEAVLTQKTTSPSGNQGELQGLVRGKVWTGQWLLVNGRLLLVWSC